MNPAGIRTEPHIVDGSAFVPGRPSTAVCPTGDTPLTGRTSAHDDPSQAATIHRSCQCGCDETPKSGNLFVHGHNARRSPQAYIIDQHGCWIWQRSFWKRNGRPRLKRNGKWRAAYRDYYERIVGPVPDGLTLDHLCRNPACVNPEHLEPVSLRENQQRAGLIKLTDVQRAQVAASTGPLAVTAAEFGISAPYVCILRGRHRRAA